MSNLNNDIGLEDLIGFMDDDANGGVTPTQGDFSNSDSDLDTSRVFGSPSNYDLDNDTEEESELDDEKETVDKPTPPPNLPTTDTSKQDTSSSTEETPSSNYEEYYNLLLENNLIHADEDFQFNGTAESLENALTQTSKNLSRAAFTSLWERLPEEWKPALKYAIAGGTDVDRYLSTFKTNSLEKLNIEESTEDQRTVLREYWKATSDHSDEKIEKFIDRLHLLGEMKNEATSALTELKEIEKETRDRIAQEQENAIKVAEEQAKEIRDTISNIIDTSDVFETGTKGKLKGYVFNPISKGNEVPSTQFDSDLQQIVANKEHYIQLADFIRSTYNPKTGFDLKRYTQKEASKATKTLKERLEALNNNKTNVSGSAFKTKESDFDWDAFLLQN